MVPFPNVPNLHYDSSTDSGSLISDQSHLINPFAVGSQSTTFINDYEGFSSFLSGSTSLTSALTTLRDDFYTLTLYEQASSDPQDLGEDFDRIAYVLCFIVTYIYLETSTCPPAGRLKILHA